MKIKTLLLLALTTFTMCIPAHVQAADKTPEEQAMSVFLTQCLVAIKLNRNVEEYANEIGFEKIRDAGANQYYSVPGKDSRISLISGANGKMCSVIMSTPNEGALTKDVEFWFGKDTPFQMTDRKDKPNKIVRGYIGQVGSAKIRVLYSYKDNKALISGGRVQ